MTILIKELSVRVEIGARPAAETASLPRRSEPPPREQQQQQLQQWLRQLQQRRRW